MFDFKKFGIIYLLIGIVIFLFVLSRLFPKATINDLSKVNVRSLVGRGSPKPSPTNAFAANISVVIVVDGEQKSYNVGAANAYLALVEAADREGKKVKVTQEKEGVMIESVGDFGGKDAVWTFTINGETQNEAADKVMLKPGDKVVWTLVRTK